MRGRERRHLCVLEPRRAAGMNHLDLTNRLHALGVHHPKRAGGLESARQGGNSLERLAVAREEEDQVRTLLRDLHIAQLCEELRLELAYESNCEPRLDPQLVRARGR